MRLVAPMVQRALEKDMDAVKNYSERPARDGAG
jgi:hypothetical protein